MKSFHNSDVKQFIIRAAQFAAAKSSRGALHRGTASRKLFLLAVVNLLVGVNVWAQVYAPTSLRATSVTSNSVSLSWVDSSSKNEKKVIVSRSLQSASGYVDVATLAAYTTSYTDFNLQPSTTYYYKVSTVNAKGTRFTAGPLAVTTLLPCTYSLYPTSNTSVGYVGGSYSVSVTLTAGAGCTRTATSPVSWITITSGASATGSGTVTYTVAQNTTSTSRSATLTIAGNSFLVTQAGTSCSFSLSPSTSAAMSAAGGNSSVGVSASSSTCSWTASNPNSWITITSATSFTGSGTVTYTVASNDGNCSPRSGTMTIAGQSYTVTQSAGTGSFSLIPTSNTSVPASGGTYSAIVSAGIGCSWASSSPVTWITITGSGTGSGSASYTVAANTSTTARSATLTIAGQGFLVTQAGATASCTAPSATTTSASGITSSGAILNGSSNPNGCATTAYFQYGTTTSYGSTTSAQSIGSGTTATSIGATIGGLASSTTYHYRLVAYNSGGTSVGADATFTTSAATANYTVTVSASPTAAGSVSGGGLLTGGTTATVSASANSGYSFANWTENGVVQSTSASYSFVVNGDRNLVANFSTLTTSPAQFIWNKRFGGSSSADYAKAISVATDIDRNVVVVGYFAGTVDLGGGAITSRGGYDGFVAKFTQSGGYIWCKQFGGTWDDRALGVTVDGSGNILVTGDFMLTATFDTVSVTSAGNGDMFISKYSSSGSHQWTKAFGGTGNDCGLAVAADSSGNISLTGYFGAYGSGVDFGGGVLTSAGQADIFVANFTSAGTYRWARRFGGTGWDESGAIAVDSSGNVALAGRFQGIVDFGSGVLYTAASDDAFVAKYSAATGSLLWSRQLGGLGVEKATGVAVDSNGNVLVTGQFSSATDFGGGLVTCTSQGDIFLAKYSSSGAYQWAKNFQMGYNAPAGKSTGVTVDPNGNSIITGSIYSPVDFGGGLLTGVSFDMFLAKISPSGLHLWSKRPAANNNYEGTAIASDAGGNISVVGPFNDSVDFGGGALINSGGTASWDSFVVKFAP